MKVHDAIQSAVVKARSREDVREDVWLQMPPSLGLELLRVGVDEDVDWTLILDVVRIGRHLPYVSFGNALPIALEVEAARNLAHNSTNPHKIWVESHTTGFVRLQRL